VVSQLQDPLESSVCRQLCRGDITLKEGHTFFLRPTKVASRAPAKDQVEEMVAVGATGAHELGLKIDPLDPIRCPRHAEYLSLRHHIWATP
jgi:hypothetical protein